MSYFEIEGDLLQLGLPAIGHGCNTAGSMAGGIARQVHRTWPVVYDEYAAACRAGAFRLGSYQVVDVGNLLVYNLATQSSPGPDARLSAIRSAVSAALVDVEERGIDEFGLPRLGSGIGGLRWSAVKDLLEGLGRHTAVRLVIVNRARM